MDATAPDAQSTLDRDFAALARAWNDRDFEDFFDRVNASGNIPDRAGQIEQLEAARGELGAITVSPTPLVDSSPPDPSAHLVARAPMATERGVMRLTVAYDESLRIIGFNVSGEAH